MGNTIEEDLKERFGEIDQRAEYNQLKVIARYAEKSRKCRLL